MRGRRTRPLAAILIAMAWAGSAHSASFTVNSEADEVDSRVGDGTCADSSGSCTLRAALMEAGASPGPHFVSLPSGVFALSRTGEGEDASASGDLDVLEVVEVRGEGPGASLLSASGLGEALFEVHAVHLHLEALTLRPSATGILAAGGTVSLRQVQVEGAPAGISATDATLLIESSEFLGGTGTALHLQRGNTVIRDSSFASNAVEGSGGAIWGEEGTLEVFDTTFEGNVASNGGGAVRLYGSSAYFQRCAFLSNRAESWGGGAVWHEASRAVDLLFSACSFVNNVAQGSGGAVQAGGTALGCSFVGNEAVSSSGGAWHGGGPPINLVQCTLSDNRAVRGGAASKTDGGLLLWHSTVAYNHATAGDGGGLYAGSFAGMSIIGTILAHNEAAANGADCFGRAAILEDSLLTDDAGCDLPDITPGLLVGTDPQLQALFEGHHDLQPTSPAIDAARDESCVDHEGVPLETDARGNERPGDGDGDGLALCDLGAIEACGTDSDADGLGDACDCAPADPGTRRPPPDLRSLRCAAGPAPGEVTLSWEDLASRIGNDTTNSVAAGSLADLWSTGLVGAPCVAAGLTDSEWTESPGASPSRYYLVRGENACGPAAGEGWGRDSLGVERAACP